jgi:hypothetical protein
LKKFHIISRLLDRLTTWLIILWNYRSFTFRGWLNLFLSALTDPVIYALSNISLNTNLVMKGLFLFRVKGLGIVLCRGGADDIIQFVPGHEGDVEEFIKANLKEGSILLLLAQMLAIIHLSHQNSWEQVEYML